MVFFARHWFLCGLVVCLYLGHQFAEPLHGLGRTPWLTPSIVATVMFAMALPLQFGQIQRVLRRPAAPILASLISLGLAPLLAFPLASLLGSELGPGLIVAAATPCTLASASVWTRKAGGNDAVSMLVTLLTNGLCFAVTPMWVRALIAPGRDAAFPIGPLMLQLLLTVLTPIVAAQLLRARGPIATWATRHKTELGVYAQLGVLTMVVIGIVQMTQRLSQSGGAPLSAGILVLCGAVVLALHLLLFGVGWQGARWIEAPRADRIAVGFSSSQKTLMVGLSAAMTLGLSVIPLVMFHLMQMVVDTILASWLKSAGEPLPESIVGWEQG